MIREIKIDKYNKFEINTSYGWLYIYKEHFGEDILPEIVPLMESAIGIAADIFENNDAVDARDVISEIAGTIAGTEATTLTNVIWALAKNANDDLPNARKWYNSFETFPMDKVIPEAFWALCESTVSQKKVKSLKEQIKKFRITTETPSASTK